MVTDHTTAALAQRMVDYETKEKGFFGKIFAFEARDGILSKIIKTAGPSLSLIGVASSVLMLANPLGATLAGVAAVAAGLGAAYMNREVNRSVLSDIHDTKTSFLGKLAHYIGAAIPALIINSVANTINPVAGLVSAAAIGPITGIYTSKIVASSYGDQELRKQSEQARQLAAQAMATGQSVEAVLQQEIPSPSKSQYRNSVTPEEYQRMNEQMASKETNHAQHIEKDAGIARA